MAVAIFMRLPGISTETYDRVLNRLDLDAMPAAGEILHVAAAVNGAIEICDVWQTPEAVDAFVDRRLRPALAAEGHAPAIEMRVLPLHNLYAADLDTVERIGSVSLPAHLAAVY